MTTPTDARPSMANFSLPGGITNLTIDAAKLRAHDMRPPHVMSARSDHGLEGRVATVPTTHVGRDKKPKPQHLQVEAFATALHAALKDNVTGYAMRLQQNGSTVYTLIWNWAQTPEDDSLGWTTARRMHVASVSKLITAIALTKLLDDKHISVDAKIIGHLPAYWAKGQNIDKITFRDLLTHQSGFATANGETDYVTMKDLVAVGVFPGPPFPFFHGNFRYENANYGLCRILIAIINGNIDRHAAIPDEAWDILTIIGYAVYTGLHVFNPSGAGDARLDHQDGDALAYNFPADGDGWNSGDLGTASGGAGWHVSIDDLLKVMGAFRRKGTIMTPAKAQQILDNGFGLNTVQPTPAGTFYVKRGLWRDDTDTDAHVEQSLAFFLPENMEMAVFANSPVGLPAMDFGNLVTGIYLNHLK